MQRHSCVQAFARLSVMAVLLLLASASVVADECPYAEDLVLGPSESVETGQETFSACRTITLESGFEVGSNGWLRLLAGETIRVRGGVRVQAGGRLNASTGIDLVPVRETATVSGEVCTEFGMCGVEFTLSEGVAPSTLALSVDWGDGSGLAETTLQGCLDGGVCTGIGGNRYRIWHGYDVAGEFSGGLYWETDAGLQDSFLFANSVTEVRSLSLQAQAGDRRATLDWEALPADQFNLCRAETAAGNYDTCVAAGGVLDTGIATPPYLVEGLTNGQDYHFSVEGRFGSERILSNETVATPQPVQLNDTGIDWCADAVANNLLCPVAGFPGQDGDFGRDAMARAGTLGKVGAGAAGFDFTKISNTGEVLPGEAGLGAGSDDWACTRDNVTGLVWEVKTESGLRASAHTYTWYNINAMVNGGAPGTQAGGTCEGGSCDTDGFVQAVNVAGLCGESDWRLPTVEELGSLTHFGVTDPAIDSSFFPNTPSTVFWSNSPYADDPDSAWSVSLFEGDEGVSLKSQPLSVRLVRGGR